MSAFPFPTDPVMTAVAIAYRNPSLIFRDVLPGLPVGKKEFRYSVFDESERMRLPSTLVGRKSRPNEVDFSSTEQNATCEDYGLEDPVPQDDIDNPPPNYAPLSVATEGLTDLIELDREKRCADLAFSAATYPAGNKTTLSGTDQWTDKVNSSPITQVMDSLDSMLMRANLGVCGRSSFSALATHPEILKAIHGNSGDSGVATRRAIADLFELDGIVVGEGWLDISKKGQPASLVRVWGGHMALLYVNPMAARRGGLTFGFTAEYKTRLAGARPDPDIGLRGGQRVRVGESVKEVICAGKAGYFIENAV